MTDEDAIAAPLERARSLAAKGEDEAAKSAYLEVLGRDPTHFTALNNLGTLAYASGHRSAARTAYAQAVRCHPGNPMGRVNLANLLYENGELRTGAGAFRGCACRRSRLRRGASRDGAPPRRAGRDSGRRAAFAEGLRRPRHRDPALSRHGAAAGGAASGFGLGRQRPDKGAARRPSLRGSRRCSRNFTSLNCPCRPMRW